MNIKTLILALVFLGGFVVCDTRAAEPGWSLQVIAFGEKREQIQQTPIIYRKYRPLHFYGNTVRRVHYHGTPIPTPRVIVEKIVR